MVTMHRTTRVCSATEVLFRWGRNDSSVEGEARVEVFPYGQQRGGCRCGSNRLACLLQNFRPIPLRPRTIILPSTAWRVLSSLSGRHICPRFACPALFRFESGSIGLISQANPASLPLCTGCQGVGRTTTILVRCEVYKVQKFSNELAARTRSQDDLSTTRSLLVAFILIEKESRWVVIELYRLRAINSGLCGGHVYPSVHLEELFLCM